MALYYKRYSPGYVGSPFQPSYSAAQPDSQYGLSLPPNPGYQSFPAQFGNPDDGPLYRRVHPPVSTSQPVATTDAKEYIVNKRYKYVGYTLVLIALAVLGVEVGNVIYTATNFSNGFSAKPFAAPYILTWIAPGIWGAIPVFITGVLSIRVAGKLNKLVRLFALFCALSAVVFTPAIVAVSITEIVMYPDITDAAKPMVGSNRCYSLSTPASLSCPKFILPLIVAVLASIAFYLTLMITIVFCCCWNPNTGIPKASTPITDTTTQAPAPATTHTTQVIDEYYPYSRFPQGGGMYPRSFNMMGLPPAGRPYFDDTVGPPPRNMMEPDMNFLSSYPVPRPIVSRGFGFAPAYNRDSYGNFPGSLPSLAGFGNQGPNPAYRVVYG